MLMQSMPTSWAMWNLSMTSFAVWRPTRLQHLVVEGLGLMLMRVTSEF